MPNQWSRGLSSLTLCSKSPGEVIVVISHGHSLSPVVAQRTLFISQSLRGVRWLLIISSRVRRRIETISSVSKSTLFHQPSYAGADGSLPRRLCISCAGIIGVVTTDDCFAQYASVYGCERRMVVLSMATGPPKSLIQTSVSIVGGSRLDCRLAGECSRGVAPVKRAAGHRRLGMVRLNRAANGDEHTQQFVEAHGGCCMMQAAIASDTHYSSMRRHDFG